MENTEQDFFNSLETFTENPLEQDIEEKEEDSINILEEEKDSNMGLNKASNDFFDEVDLSKIPEEFSMNDPEVAKSEIIDNKEDLKLGLTAEDLKDLFNYVSGKGNKPLFID